MWNIEATIICGSVKFYITSPPPPPDPRSFQNTQKVIRLFQGIAISHTSDFKGDVFVTEKFSLRHVDTTSEQNGAIEVTLRREGDAQTTLKTFSRMLKLKMDHPTNEDFKLELMVNWTMPMDAVSSSAEKCMARNQEALSLNHPWSQGH